LSERKTEGCRFLRNAIVGGDEAELKKEGKERVGVSRERTSV